MKIKTLFLGTSDFALEIIRSILASNYLDLVAVVTQPDRPFGRKKVITPPPVKSLISLEAKDIKIFQPEKIKLDYKSILDEVKPEIIIVAAYGQILPEEFLNYPVYGSFNFHGSILPDLRGAIPIQAALLKGYKKTGVTLQKMVKEMDAGDIVAIRETAIKQDDDYITLEKKLSDLSAEIINSELKDYINGKIVVIKQEEAEATYCYIKDITFESAEIKFSDDKYTAINKIKAYSKSPVAWVRLENGKILKIFKAKINSNDPIEKITGLKLLKDRQKNILLCLRDGQIELLDMQLEGKTRGKPNDYAYLTNDYIN